ncbi:MAG: DUF1501 domain-containing protein [Acidobacteria bacterium]|nr:DUF1501 domain-containing protein [Acidobacteriota bacterium]
MNLPQFAHFDARRRFLREFACGFGGMALSGLLDAAESPNPLAPKPSHFPGKAKSVIFLFMEGGPSQMDLFDPKPALAKHDGKPLPAEFTKDLKLAFTKPNAAALASPRQFQPCGQSGVVISDYLPHLREVADDLCVVRSMHTEAVNHHPGQLMLFGGSIQGGRPTSGAWVTYGLGSESKNLPGFVVLSSGSGTSGGASNFSSGFLPSTYQGTIFRSAGDAILYLSNPEGVSRNAQRAGLDVLKELNEEHLAKHGDPEIAARIQSYELAFRMQMSAPELLDFSGESQETLEMYGLNDEKTKQFGTNCLLARRLVERGVRYVLLMDASWDTHTNLNKKLQDKCLQTDRGSAALIKDLKRRGLLDSTLVAWGGEFGRTPICEIRNTRDPENAGRDHHPSGYSMWLAGGGIRGGVTYGETDELGFTITRDKVHIHDLQATMLHCLGLDHLKLTFRHLGRDYRLTDVGGNVIKGLLA